MKMKFESLSMQRFESAKMLENQLRAVTGGVCRSEWGNNQTDWIGEDGRTTFGNGTTSNDDPACVIGGDRLGGE